jgi:hypothetical protein
LVLLVLEVLVVRTQHYLFEEILVHLVVFLLQQTVQELYITVLLEAEEDLLHLTIRTLLDLEEEVEEEQIPLELTLLQVVEVLEVHH